MSALLNHNAIRYIPWKDQTIFQITSSKQQNKGTVADIFNPTPLKIVRREIAANIPDVNTCVHSRTSSTIADYERPASTITVAVPSNTQGLVNIEQLPGAQTRYEQAVCTTPAVCIENNARRRVRSSSGVIRKGYNGATDNYTYYTDTKQYLTARSRTFHQNQYAYTRYGEPSLLNSTNATTNVRSPNGTAHCPKTEISAAKGNNVFYYYWVDWDGTTVANRYTVTIPDGFYDVNDLNYVLEHTMDMNKHYMVINATNSKKYLLKIIYNLQTGQIELQSYYSDQYKNTTNYSLPFLAGWTLPATSCVPVLSIPATNIRSVLGFAAANYPSGSARLRTTNYAVLSSGTHSLQPSYIVNAYKPNNARFAQQGGVSSSSLTVRKKYDTMTRNGVYFANALGTDVANAMAYGVSEHVYTRKDKTGVQTRKTPVVKPGSTQMIYCAKPSLSHAN